MRPAYSPFYAFCKFLTLALSRVFFWRSIVGREHWIDGPAIIASNHASFLDPPAVGGSCPGQIGYLARKSLLRMAFFRKVCDGLSTIPVERDAADFGSIKRILTALKQGRKILMFPEGERTFDGELQKPMAGVGFLVHQAGVPVIPAYVHGTFHAWPRHRALPRPGKLVVVFGPPIRFEKQKTGRPKRERYQEIADEVMARIAALKPQAYSKL